MDRMLSVQPSWAVGPGTLYRCSQHRFESTRRIMLPIIVTIGQYPRDMPSEQSYQTRQAQHDTGKSLAVCRILRSLSLGSSPGRLALGLNNTEVLVSLPMYEPSSCIAKAIHQSVSSKSIHQFVSSHAGLSGVP